MKKEYYIEYYKADSPSKPRSGGFKSAFLKQFCKTLLGYGVIPTRIERVSDGKVLYSRTEPTQSQ